MKVLLFLCFASLAGLIECSTENPLIALAEAPINKWFQDFRDTAEKWTVNSQFLQKLDINHTLERLINLGEVQVKDILFNKVLPWIMSILQGPGTVIRSFLVTLRDRVKTLDVNNLTAQLPAYIKSLDTYLGLAISTFDQMKNGGFTNFKNDVPSTDKSTSASNGTKPTSASNGTKPSSGAPTAAPSSGWWVFG